MQYVSEGVVWLATFCEPFCLSLVKCKANRRPALFPAVAVGKKMLSERIYEFIKHFFLRFHTSRELSAMHDLR